MVATAPPNTPHRLRHGDAALDAALANLLEALEAFRGAGRADLAAPLRSAVTAARQTELLRRAAPGALPERNPVDWFQE